MFAAIWIPRFRLQAAMRWRELPPAVALVDADAARGVILEATSDAGEQGVTPGLTSAQGLARCPGLRLIARAPAQEQACEALLAEVAWRFSPRVEATGSGIATLDLRAAPKGACWQRLAENLAGQLDAESLESRVGVARHPEHALLAARCADRVNVVYDGGAFCAGLPVRALEPDERLCAILEDWGIRTVGDFLRLPKMEVIERLGADAERMWRRATGRGRRALRLLQPRESLIEAFDFEHGIETTEPLLFLLRRFLDSLCARLRSAHRVASKMALRLPLDGGGAYAREFSVPSPTSDVEILYRILDTHLDALRLDNQPIGLRLELFASDPLGRQLALFERGLRDPNGFGATLARLQAMVGENGVGTPQPADSHRPGAFLLEAFSDEPAGAAAVPPSFGLPLRRLRPGHPVAVRIVAGRPAWLDAPQWSGPVSRACGPYRVSGQWWECPWSLEEWDVAVEGRGLIRLARQQNGWSVEGAYDLR
ncbi:MAG: hypothetical protein PHC88_06705 [Terrimicrobiaceae bacterium]|nr:hypothetical protein [Terrimicrobiaceae bacterium]